MKTRKRRQDVVRTLLKYESLFFFRQRVVMRVKFFFLLLIFSSLYHFLSRNMRDRRQKTKESKDERNRLRFSQTPRIQTPVEVETGHMEVKRGSEPKEKISCCYYYHECSSVLLCPITYISTMVPRTEFLLWVVVTT